MGRVDVAGLQKYLICGNGVGAAVRGLTIMVHRECEATHRGIRDSPSKIRRFQNMHCDLGIREGLCGLHEVANMIHVPVSPEDV